MNRYELPDENETPTGENILIVALSVAILAGCGILFIVAWAAQDPNSFWSVIK